MFFVFRFAAEGLVVMMFYFVYKQFSLRGMAGAFWGANTPEQLVDRLRRACGHSGHWLRHFPDEFLFFGLVEDYLRGEPPALDPRTHWKGAVRR